MNVDTIAVAASKGSADQTRSTFTPRRRSLLQRMWRARTSYAMLLPFLVPFVIFGIYPVITSAFLSLTNFSGSITKSPEYVGFQNYSDLLSIHVMEYPRLTDETTGEEMFSCGRTRIVASELAAYQAENPAATCEPAFVRAREILPEGYSEFNKVSLFGKTYLIGATDTRFITAIINTAVYVVYSTLLKVVIGLFLALTLSKQTRFNMVLRVIFFLPSVTASIVIAVLWGYIFRGASFGLINSFLLSSMSITEPISFLNNANYTMMILVIMSVWGGIGYNMILFLAGLQNIPAEYHEAAAIDGANARQRLWYLTLPLLRPTFVFVVVTGVIGAFQVFEPIYILFATAEGMGGALDSALTVVPYLYDSGFRLFQLGYASAIAWILFIIIFALTMLNLRIGRANEAY